MRRNMGGIDRALRAFVVAPLLVVGGVLASGALAVVLYALAAVMLVTAAIGFCPLYAPFGFSTAPGREASAGS